MSTTTSRLMEWRVMLCPIDDWDDRPTPDVQRRMIDDCVGEFRKRLEEELRRGELVVGYGPVR